MGKNILCILSSPRQNSNSGLLAEAVLEGAAEHGGKAEVIRLVERNINPCHGCFACTRSDRGCVQHDGMTDLYPLIASADALVMATPIYYFNMSGQLKTFIDRCIAVDVGGGKRGLRGKKLAVTMAYEGEDPFDSGCINAIRCFQDICRYTGMELKGQAYGTALEPGAILANKKLLDEARELGRIQSLLSEQKATSTQYRRISATGNAAERDPIRPKASGREGPGEKTFSREASPPIPFSLTGNTMPAGRTASPVR